VYDNNVFLFQQRANQLSAVLEDIAKTSGSSYKNFKLYYNANPINKGGYLCLLKHNNNKTKAKIKICVRAGNWTWYLCSGTAVWCDTPWPLRNLNVSIVVNLYNRCSVMHPNVKKINTICGSHFLKNIIFSVTFEHTWINIPNSFA